MKVIQSKIPEQSGKPKFQKNNVKTNRYFPPEDEEDDDEDEEEDKEESEKERYIRIMVNFKEIGVTMPIYSIETLEKSEEFFDRPKPHYKFGIIINKGMEVSMRYPRVDVEIWFLTVEKRDERYDEIIKALEKEGVKVIDL